ncbi:hypothetical protein VB776_00185 [Arcicella sp. DC2W]|uniref:DUF4304 domain-containing protein n=1 Tax=Arcicella gelida TaxID=2984195 RepID=A0ABU5RYL0_9BACT|nr:hypothetical protein [Arcicella sp. DC2W]MEA5401308.1 hypothetical protein [Arcicella sp. DC2W]
MQSVRKELFDILKPYFNDRKYKLMNNMGAPQFIRFVESDYVIHFYMNFFSTNTIFFTRFNISHWDVENVILEIGLPNIGLDSYINKDRYFLPTIVDRSVININEDRPLETKKQVQEYAKAIKQYTETNGKAFLDKYSYLPNLLLLMNALESEDLNWNNREKGGLHGSLDAYFRGLIISKLCNDPDFESKLNRMDKKFNDPSNEEWQPYYEQLKLKLSALSPKYNL